METKCPFCSETYGWDLNNQSPSKWLVFECGGCKNFYVVRNQKDGMVYKMIPANVNEVKTTHIEYASLLTEFDYELARVAKVTL